MFEEIIRQGDECRAAYKDGISAYVDRLEKEGAKKREAFMPPASFYSHIEEYRAKYIAMLGLDELLSEDVPKGSLIRVGEDEDADIYRLTVYITAEIPAFGLLFVPHGVKKAPLIIAQHGGGGTPELCADLHGKNNYNHMVRRALEKGAVVYAPQLLLWNQKEPLPTQPLHAIPYDRIGNDKDLKRFGMSITALEICGIMNAISYLSVLPYVEKEKIGMMGISYGGYFTLYTMAADTRIKAGYSNAVFNDRNAYPWFDWSYFGAGNRFHDAEVAALCAPRKLFVAVGKDDTVFDFSGAVTESERAKKYFEGALCPQNFAFMLWDGGHTMPDADDGIDFMFSAFK